MPVLFIFPALLFVLLDSKPWLTHGEWAMVVLTGIYVMLTGAYVLISGRTLKAIKRQADLTEEQGESNARQFREQLTAMSEARKQTDELIKQATAQADALGKQALAAEIAANSATKTAEAALLNAQALMKAERAWILFKKIVATSVRPQEKAWCIIHFRNVGNTPGKVTFRAIELQIGDRDTEPPNAQAVFERNDKEMFMHIVTPKAIDPVIVNIVPNPLLTPELHDDLFVKKTKFLWLCGIVKYHDVFEGVSESHETRFCYLYRTLEGSDKLFWIPTGPRQYNQAT